MVVVTRYARAFFDLQVAFAQTVSDLSSVPLERALLDYTNLYIRFRLGRDFDPAHPTWQEYLGGLREQRDVGAWTHHFYASRAQPTEPPGLVATFGCFSYAKLEEDRIRLHFQNAEADGDSPLGKERRERRLRELAALFAHLRDTMREPVRVTGASWLYNVPAYRCLFPESYLATARVAHHRFRHMPLWGQFLDRHGEMRESVARTFRERLGRLQTVHLLDECFPFQVLSVETPASEFYEFYGVYESCKCSPPTPNR
jgi:hypothetical protein